MFLDNCNKSQIVCVMKLAISGRAVVAFDTELVLTGPLGAVIGGTMGGNTKTFNGS